MRAIIFDFGNVLGFFDHYRTLNRLTAYTDMTPEEMYAAVYTSAVEEEYESGRLTTAQFLDFFRHLCRLRCDDAVLSAAVADIFTPNAAVCALVPRLKPRYRLVLGSNTNELHATHFRRQFAATFAHFDALVLSHEVGTRKPRAEFFEHCRRLADVPAHECVFVDDMPANIDGARRCGLHGIVYRSAEELLASLRELEVEV